MNASDNRAFADIAARAQRLANERGGDYSALTIDELCAFMVEFDEALSTHGEPPRFYRAAADGAASDLAEAIYAGLTSPAGIDYALELWHEGRGLLTERDRFDLLLPVLARSVIDAVLTRRLREAARTGPWENDGQFLAYAGTDARKWAAEFCRIARDHGHDLDEGWVIGWFANAIEHARTGYERMQEALERIVSWSEAYPLDIFPEPDLEKARQLLKAGGIALDAVTAHCMRHVIDGVGKIAREAARTGPWDGGHHFQEEDGYPGSLLPPKRGEP